MRYSAPKGKLTATLREEIARSKDDIIRFLEQMVNTQCPKEVPIPKVSPQEPLPLSFGQQRLWFLNQLEKGQSATYNMHPMVAQLSGHLNITALEKTLLEICQRHEILRTSFQIQAGHPVQVTNPQVTLPLSVISLEDLTPVQQQEEIRHLTRLQAEQPFDLTQVPLLRVQLAKLGPAEHVFFLTMHHIISDGWSLGILVRELSTLYQAYHQNQTSPLAPLPIQYADFAVWQRHRLSGQFLETLTSYWKQQLNGIPALLELPTDFPRRPVQRYRGKAEYLYLSQDLTRGLHQLSQQSGVSLFMTLLTAFAILLFRHTGQPDIVIGSPIANRTHTQLEPLIGFFLNTLVYRVNCADSPRFSELLQRVKHVCLEAYAHQDLPFEKLVEELHPERNLSHTPLFQVMLVLQNAPMEEIKLAHLTLTPLPTENIDAVLDLLLDVEETPKGLECKFRYNTDLFEETTIKRLGGHFQTLVEGILAQPDQAVQTLPLLTTAELAQLMTWNQTQVDYPKDQTIVELFQTQVAKTPLNLAVVFETQTLTYRELNAKANQLAHYLMTLGVTAETLVGICVERSLEMVVGLLGILKAGGAYVPLDPAFPNDRLTFYVEDANVTILVTQSNLTELFASPIIQRVCLDTDSHLLVQQPSDNPHSGVTPANLAYVIYTSGSTGKPKGVMIGHQAVVNFLFSMREKPGLTSQDVLMAVTTISFDIAGLELYLPLLVGAKIVLASRESVTDGPQLLQNLVSSGTTVMQATPATWRLLLASGWEVSLPLKVLCGGEALTRKLSSQLLDKSGAVWNLYGPTETTIWSAVHRVSKSEELDASEVAEPLGYPIANTQFYILDTYSQVVPVGVAGELHIGGDGLARGYLNRPELTAAKFIPHPFSNDPAARIYKTGDLARYLPDGVIEYLGRLDNQVKIRGFRIELGEIEAVLVQHPAVREAVVISWKEQTTASFEAAPRLVAYVVTAVPVTPTELRQFLKGKLPEYMVPATFLLLDALPLSPNGKVDRRALPSPEGSRTHLETTYVAPQTPLEQQIASVWSEVIGVEKIGRHDNFFELGGDSIKAAIVINRLQEPLRQMVYVVALFEAPTIAEFIVYLHQHYPKMWKIFSGDQTWELTNQSDLTHFQNGLGLDQSVLRISPIARTGRLPLSFAQQRLWFLSQLEGASATYNVALAMRLEGSLQEDAVRRSFQALVQRQESLRVCFPTVNGEPLVQIVEEMKMTLLTVDLRNRVFDQNSVSAKAEQEVQRLIAEDAQVPFNLETGPLFRATWLRLSETSQVLILNLHHIISDGWSVGILIQEWGALYQAFSQGLPSPLPPLPIQYVDFAAWQQQWLTGERLAQQVRYWKQQLAGAPVLLELPTDRPRPPIQRFEGASVYFTVSVEELAQLKQFSQQAGATLFMTLLAAFGVLLSRHSGQTDIVVGSPMAGRTLAELESLIGFFVNTLVLRMNLAENPSFADFLQQVRKTALEAYTHQDIPFVQLVEELQPTRSLSYTPLFQVMFILQNAPAPTLELPDLTATPLVQDSVIAKFDLTFTLEETAEGLVGTVEYNTDLFETATIQRLIGHYQTLLTSILSHPDQPVWQLPLLTTREQRQLLVEWNQTQVDYPTYQCIHQLFETQVEKTPAAIAVTFEEHSLTYRQLNQRANQLAHYLHSLGVQPDMLVGICLERSLDLVVGLLGILKAGGAYVPLDPSFPKERLTYYMEDAKVAIWLTQTSLVDLLATTAVPMVCLDAPALLSSLASQSQENFQGPVTFANLAYVIYTSGSTGKPKGVMVEHQAAVNFLFAIRDQLGLTDREVFLAVSTYSFDVTILEFYLPWMIGAKIILASRELAREGSQLLEKLETSGITVMQATPATWRLLLAAGWKTKLPLKILCGSEALTRELAGQLLSRSEAVWNLYGPTETTVWSATYRVFRTSEKDSCEPLGRPIANKQFYVLDAHSQLVPIGVTGELYIGGDWLARGYLNRPELTAEKFIRNPFREGPHSRLYKTGDLVRYRPDGNLEFLGRMDNQVKIRGFRIELGEIEATLIQHPALREGVVTVHTDATGDQRLVAYVTTHPDQSLEVMALREFLKNRLPEYMIPSIFVFLETLPLTPTGKVNRRALPVPENMARSLTSPYIAPRDTMELQLVPLWEELLKVHPIGVQDNFFDLGGHSLLAVRMMAQIEQQFQKRLLLASLFQGATIAQQAQLLRQETELKWSSLVPIQPNGHRPPFFGIAGAGGHVLYFYELARHLGADQPFYGLQPQGLDGESAPHQTVEEMAEYYIETMRTVQPRGPYQMGGHSFGGLVAFEMTQQLRKQGEEVALLAILDTPVPPPSKRHSKQDDWDDAQWLVHLSHIMEHLYHTQLSVRYETLRELAPALQLSYVHEQLKRAQILPPSASLNPFRGIVEVYKANVRTHYYPKVVSPVPITLFKATEVQPEPLTVAEGSNEEAHKDPAFGWRKFGQVEIVEVPGDHLTMLTMPHVAVLAERLMTHLMREVVRN